MKGDCRLCNQLGVQPLLSAQALKMIASSRLLKVQPVLAERPALHAAPRSSGVPSPTSGLGDVSLWSPLDARCVSTPMPFLLIHELLLQLVSDDTVGDWLGWLTAEKSWPSHWRIGRSALTCLRKSHLVQPSACGRHRSQSHWA